MSTPGSPNSPNNICKNCTAAFALNVRAAELETEPPKDMSESRLAMQRNEAKTAGDALNQAAGTIACHKIEKPSVELPAEVPPIGSQELIDLVKLCPSFPEYMRIRTGQ